MRVSICFILLIFIAGSAAAQQVPTTKSTSPSADDIWMNFMQAGGGKLKKGDYNGAVASYTECLNAKKAFACYYGRATANMALKKYALAMKDANDGLTLAPEASEMYSLRATLHLVDDDLTAALSDLDKAIEFDPEEPDYYLERADLQCSMTVRGVSLKILARKDQEKAKELGGEVVTPCK